MDLETARTLTGQLWPPASKGGPGGELEWTIAQTLANQFAAEPLATLAQPSEGAAWLLFKGQPLLEIKGRIVLERDPEPDEDERFARLLAGSVGWSALA